jgi:hypothetical protein
MLTKNSSSKMEEAFGLKNVVLEKPLRQTFVNGV